jgi:hypothetical protein
MIEALAVSAMAALAPYLGKAAEGFAGKFGEKFADKVGSLYKAVKKAFTGDAYAEQTLARAEADPSPNNQSTLKTILTEKLQKDPELQKLLEQLLNEARAVDSNNVIAIGERSVAIGGDNSGVIITGGDTHAPNK